MVAFAQTNLATLQVDITDLLFLAKELRRLRAGTHWRFAVSQCLPMVLGYGEFLISTGSSNLAERIDRCFEADQYQVQAGKSDDALKFAVRSVAAHAVLDRLFCHATFQKRACVDLLEAIATAYAQDNEERSKTVTGSRRQLPTLLQRIATEAADRLGLGRNQEVLTTARNHLPVFENLARAAINQAPKTVRFPTATRRELVCDRRLLRGGCGIA